LLLYGAMNTQSQGIAALVAGVVLALVAIWGAVGALEESPNPTPSNLVVYDEM